jgi:hypothetical protein
VGIYLGIAICCLAGVALFVYSIIRIIRTVVFLRFSRKTAGTVVDFATAKNSDHHTTYLPIIEFMTEGNRIVRIVSTVASNPPAYQTGERVEIRFLPKNPEIARIDSFSEIWMVTIIVLLIAFLCLGIAYALVTAYIP